MRFSTVYSAALAFAATAMSQTAGFDAISAPATDEVVPAGQDYTIVWAPNSEYNGTVTISLLGGSSPSTLNTVETIATGIDTSAGKYVWSVEKTLGSDVYYGIQITLDSDTSIFQWGFHFKISAVAGSSSYSTAAISTGGYSTSATKTATSAKSTSVKTSASYSATSSAPYPTTTATGNGTTTATTTGGSGATTLTSTTSVAAASKTTSSGVSVPTNAANRAAAGTVALFGGLAAAMFAL